MFHNQGKAYFSGREIPTFQPILEPDRIYRLWYISLRYGLFIKTEFYLPFTTHTELMDASLFRSGLSLARITARHFTLGIDPVTGAIDHLVDYRSGWDWAAPDHLMGLFRYQTFSQDDYDHYLDEYLSKKPDLFLFNLYNNIWGLTSPCGSTRTPASGSNY